MMICPECKTEPMIWYKPWNRYICGSWWYMEGGCKTWNDMDYPIRITTVCKCKRTIVVIATEYKVHNQDGSLHTCGGTMADSEHLTYRDCSYYISRSSGDESQSYCGFTGKLCDADEAGLECSMWEEEKAEILKEDLEILTEVSGTLKPKHTRTVLLEPIKEEQDDLG